MGVLKKIFLIVFFLGVVLFVGVSIYIQRNGKLLFEKKFSAALRKEVHIGKARVTFPLGLRFDNIEIKDALDIQVVRAHLGLPLFFDGHFNIAKLKLTKPVFFFTHEANNKVVWGKVDKPDDKIVSASSVPLAKPEGIAVNFSDIFRDIIATDTASPAESVNKAKRSRGVVIDYLDIKDGRVEVFGQRDGSVADIGQINLKAMHVSFPARNIKTRFDFTARVLGKNVSFEGQKIEARGVINFIARDMDVIAKIVDKAGNSIILGHSKSEKNDMTVKGTINIARFVSGMKTKDSKEYPFEGFLSTALESSGVEIGVDFVCQTKMDDINCEKLEMSGKVVQMQKNP